MATSTRGFWQRHEQQKKIAAGLLEDELVAPMGVSDAALRVFLVETARLAIQRGFKPGSPSAAAALALLDRGATTPAELVALFAEANKSIKSETARWVLRQAFGADVTPLAKFLAGLASDAAAPGERVATFNAEIARLRARLAELTKLHDPRAVVIADDVQAATLRRFALDAAHRIVADRLRAPSAALRDAAVKARDFLDRACAGAPLDELRAEVDALELHPTSALAFVLGHALNDDAKAGAGALSLWLLDAARNHGPKAEQDEAARQRAALRGEV